jgi:hypothetical protein
MDLKAILKMLAFIGVLVAGVIIVIIAVKTKHYAYLALLPFCLFGGITGFIYGRSGEPSGSIHPPGTGGKFLGLPDWVTWVDFILLALGIIVIVIAR